MIPQQSVIKLIDKAMKSRDTSVRGAMATEIQKHLEICVERAETFLGRDEELAKVRRGLVQNSPPGWISTPDRRGRFSRSSRMSRRTAEVGSWLSATPDPAKRPS